MIYGSVRDTIRAFLHGNFLTQGAALSYYTFFAIAPLFILVLAIAGLCFGEDAARKELFGQLNQLVGQDGGNAIQALVAAAKRGDEKAFETLVRRHRPRILALALRYTRVREDAEDVVQQALQKAFIYLNSFEGKSLFSTWITRIAINEALMWLDRKSVV